MNLFRKKLPKNNSYSQTGEDTIISFLLASMNIQKPFYIDIGCHDPVYMSNTYLFYQRGSHGICVEANPKLARQFNSQRPRDQVVNCAIVTDDQESCDFYIMDADSISTTSVEEVKNLQENSTHKVQYVEKVPCKKLSEIFAMAHQPVDVLSLDIEADMLDIMKEARIDHHRPKIICIETLQYCQNGTGKKNRDIIEYLKSCNYKAYADTYINTIFIDKNCLTFQIDEIV